jgi:G3E family GTPase
MSDVTEQTNGRVPVTVLTGFLGSGKTTLLNRILTENHGKRIAVIENEFGEIGVDQELVINAEEEVFEMNNGCICCTVRGDLIRILGNLMKRKDRFDYIMVETTGLADPGPVAQTFFVDEEMQSRVALDGIVTLVDAKHIWEHIDDSGEAKEQIAFADVILLNKTDLVAPENLDKLEARIKGMNSAARIYRTRDAVVELDNVLNLGGFNLERALAVDPKFLEPEYPFEWSGVYELEPGRYEFVLQPGPDPTMNIVLLPLKDATPESLEAVKMDAVLIFSDHEFDLMPAESFSAGKQLWQLKFGGEVAPFPVEIKRAGAYALFTEHKPEEFGAGLIAAATGSQVNPVLTHDYKPDHEHDDEVSSVGINVAGDLDEKRLNEWLRDLLINKGTDIFRMKGVLSIKGQPNRFVFQGVHMLFDGRPDRPWGAGERHNSLIFIGRKLDRAELNEGFKKCLA